MLDTAEEEEAEKGAGRGGDADRFAEIAVGGMDVVVGGEADEDQVGLVGEDFVVQDGEVLAEAIAGDAKVEAFDATGRVGFLDEAFEDAGPGLFGGDALAEGEGIAHDGDAKGIGGFGKGEVALAEAAVVGAEGDEVE